MAFRSRSCPGGRPSWAARLLSGVLARGPLSASALAQPAHEGLREGSPSCEGRSGPEMPPLGSARRTT